MGENNKVSLVTVYNNDGNLLLGKRRDNNKFTLIAGHANGNENSEQTAIREMYEESGLHPISLSFITEFINKDGTKVSCFSAYVGSGNPTNQFDPDDEIEKWEWVDINGGLESRYYNNLHGPEEVDDNLLKQIFDLKPKEELKKSIEYDVHWFKDRLDKGAPPKEIRQEEYDDPHKTHKVMVRLTDPDNQLLKLINSIKNNANIGHAIQVRVDKQHDFECDGDGPFRINDIEVKDVGGKWPVEITVTLRDPTRDLTRIIECIGKLSAPGHSFDVVLDPDDAQSERRIKHGIDGDGCFYIKEISESKPEALAKSEFPYPNNQDEVYRLLSHGDPNERRQALKLNSVKPEHLNYAALSNEPEIYRAAIDHPLFGEDEIYNLLLAKMGFDSRHPLEQQAYLFSKPDRIKSHYLDALYRGVQNLPYNEKSNAIDIIASHALTEANLLRSMYLNQDSNFNQKMMIIRHQNTPDDVLEHAFNLGIDFPSDETTQLHQNALINEKVKSPLLVKLLRMAVERPQDQNIQKLAQNMLVKRKFEQNDISYLMQQNKLYPGSHVGGLLTNALNGPSGSPEIFDNVTRENGYKIWENNNIPENINQQALDDMVSYAVKNKNQVFLNRLMDHKLFNTKHLNTIFLG